MQIFTLPECILDLVKSRNKLKSHFATIFELQRNEAELRFTFDGNLVGDLGEALAVELFGIKLIKAKSVAGIDGTTSDGEMTVQVKATCTGRGPAFRNTKKRADHLLFFDLDLDGMKGLVVFNGPEHYAFNKLKSGFKDQRSLTASQIRKADLDVKPTERPVPLTK